MAQPAADKAPKRLSAFSVLLIMATLMVVGVSMVPLLNVQYTPAPKQSTLSISYQWPDASARILEQEVTSKLEGVLSSIRGIEQINSVSGKGYGYIDLTFKKGAKVDALRFEIANQVRQLYSHLPQGVTYPALSLSTTGNRPSALLTYTLNADLPPDQIEKFARNRILNPLAKIKGINSVELSGATPFEWVITYDPQKSSAAGVRGTDIAAAFESYFAEDVVGSISRTDSSGAYQIGLKLKNEAGRNFDRIPIKTVDGKILRLGDFATVTYREALPRSYNRINGLNTINITIYPERQVNILEVAKQVKGAMQQLEEGFPDGFSVLLSYDASQYIDQELQKVILRTVLSLLILLLFVFIASRSLRYLLIIAITLMANILVAVIFYNLFQLEIHLYSLAGITISLGIIIDTAIIMTDHYSYYGDRKVFLAILGALLTTIGSLGIVFLLPEEQKANLVDFVAVIMVNLSVSLIIALLFIPALLEKLPLRRGISQLRRRTKRRVAKISALYGRYIAWSRRHRWIYIILFILGFGIPIHLLPPSLKEGNELKTGFFPELYNKTLSSTWYQSNQKWLEASLGGSLRLFTKSIGTSGFYREPQRTTLYINAGMPEGCTIHQLNDIVRYMENYLSQFEEIDMFRTEVRSYDQASITVTFKKEAEKSGFPLMLKNRVIQQAINYGGAVWGVYGIDDQGFSNNIMSGYKSNQIKLTGYNYDMLYGYAQQLVDTLRVNKRVSEPGIYGIVYWGSLLKNEYFIRYNREKIATTGLNLGAYYAFLEQQLFNQRLASVFDGQDVTSVVLTSGEKDQFDLWHVENDLFDVDSIKSKLNDIGSIAKTLSGNDIYKDNQSYMLTVAFDFVGSYELAQKVVERQVERLNGTVLPIGYAASATQYQWGGKEQSTQVWLILLVILIIYFICAILFESLVKPLVIILMIPISFIGVFLTFALGKFRFDQGGFAAFVLLCGVVVNAGIYVVNEYNIIYARNPLPGGRVYLKAYNRKIIPILLTILSTVLGLIPFLYNGDSEVFWFSFAVGTMGGMLFSIIALIVFLPIFMPLKK